MKKILAFLIILAGTGFALDYTTGTMFNPFTSTLDYITTGFSTLNVSGNITAEWFFGKFNLTENSPYLDFTGGYLLSFNETKLNATIDARERDTFWNITGSAYLMNNSGILDVNETKLNATIDAREIDTRWSLTGPYLYNNSGSLDLNETYLNATVDASPTFVKIAGDTMTGDLNMGSQNVTSVDCIVFSSGGAFCSAP